MLSAAALDFMVVAYLTMDDTEKQLYFYMCFGLYIVRDLATCEAGFSMRGEAFMCFAFEMRSALSEFTPDSSEPSAD